MGCGCSPAVTVGSTGSLCTVVGRPHSTSRVAGFHQWRSWDSRSWTGEMWLSCKEEQCELLGFCVPCGKRVSGATCRVTGFLPSVRNLVFLHFDRGERARLLSGTVGSAGPHSMWGEKHPGVSRIAKPRVWGSLKCAVMDFWHWVECWGYSWGSKASGLKLSGAYKAVEALGSTCVGARAPRSHGSCCRHKEPMHVGSESTEAYLLAFGNCCRHRRTKPVGSEISGACFPGVGSRRAVR
jgi:hypothetical protein